MHGRPEILLSLAWNRSVRKEERGVSDKVRDKDMDRVRFALRRKTTHMYISIVGLSVRFRSKSKYSQVSAFSDISVKSRNSVTSTMIFVFLFSFSFLSKTPMAGYAPFHP